jgi:hypothetical protein
MQYFLGLPSFQTQSVFDYSLLSILRKRLGKEGAKELNDIFISYAIEHEYIKHRKERSSLSNTKQDDTANKKDHDDRSKGVDQTDRDEHPTREGMEEALTKAPKAPINKGTVKIDATVVPQDITYPTDTKLLNKSREISEQIIDVLYKHNETLWDIKPRSYRQNARKGWLSFSKSRKSSNKKIRQQKKADLGYLRRNLRHIDEMIHLLLEQGICIQIDETLRKKLYVISEVYRQQKLMYDSKTKKISDRIVSIAQPWVRPIVRGKAGKAVEFGAKINISLSEKIVTIDQSDYNAFNESKYLIDQLESYKDRYGYYPAFALVDQIYLTRANRKYMKSHGIKHTGKPLGRPKSNANKPKPSERKKNNERNHVEGKIGQAIQKYGLDKLRTKLQSTSYCALQLIALAINMMTLQKSVFWAKFSMSTRIIMTVTMNYN